MIHRTVHSLKKLPRRVRTRLSHHLVSPTAVFSLLGVEEGQTVLELGNPVGFFAAAALKAVGKPGKVIVAGANDDALERVGHLGHHPQLETTLLADVLLGRAFDHKSVDWVLLTNVLSSSLNPDHFCIAVTQYVRPGGYVVLLDWQELTAAGPQADRRVSREQAIRLMAGCGLKFHHALATPGYQYALVFEITAR
ncbi:MAG: hypothetical protein U0526_03775 [Candidatus Saccharibacteria bacterium]